MFQLSHPYYYLKWCPSPTPGVRKKPVSKKKRFFFFSNSLECQTPIARESTMPSLIFKEILPIVASTARLLISPDFHAAFGHYGTSNLT